MPNAEVMREKQLLVRLNQEEWERAEAVARHYGVSSANAVRILLKEKARELGLVVVDEDTIPRGEAWQHADRIHFRAALKKNANADREWTDAERSHWDGATFVLVGNHGKVLRRVAKADIVAERRGR